MDIQTFLKNVIIFLNKSIIPFLITIAFLVFLWNIMRYFIFQGADEKAHENARSLALWGITAFVIMLSFWGIINFLIIDFGFGGQQQIVPDYMSTGGARGNSNTGDSDSCIGHDYSLGPC